MSKPAVPRRVLLGSGGACLALFVVIAVLVRARWAPLLDLDRALGRAPQSFTFTHHAAKSFFLVVQRVLDPTLLLGVVIIGAVLLWGKGHRRAATYAVGSMAAVRIANPLLKLVFDRSRPEFTDPVELLTSNSFPSGHASGAAGAAVVAVTLTTMLVRRRGLRQVLVTLSVLAAVLTGLDRIFLGVHYPSDVVAGALLGTGICLVARALYDPLPRSMGQAAGTTATPGGEGRRLAVVLNPVKVDSVPGFKAMVEGLARDSGLSGVTWHETTVADIGHGQAHEAAVAGAEVVMCVGGDGTVRAVCEELAGTGIPVGIVPAGTGNLLARNLSIPLFLRTAVDVAINGQDQAIDMVRVGGDHMEDSTFLVMAGMGLDAAVMEGVNEDAKAKVGWLAYVWSALRSLMFPAIRVEVSIDGGEFTRHRARTVVVGNVGSLQAGMPLLPDASIDDGQLDVVLLDPRRFLSWIPLALRVLSKNRRTDSTITRMTGRSVLVRATTEAPRQLDGDLIAPGKELRAECVHGRLLVRVPR